MSLYDLMAANVKIRTLESALVAEREAREKLEEQLDVAEGAIEGLTETVANLREALQREQEIVAELSEIARKRERAEEALSARSMGPLGANQREKHNEA